MLTKKKVEFQQLSRIVDLGVFLGPRASSSGLRSAVVDGECLDAPPSKKFQTTQSNPLARSIPVR